MPLIHPIAVTSKVLAILTLLVRQGSNFFMAVLGGRSLEMEEYRLYWAKYSLTKSDLYVNMLAVLPHVFSVTNLFWGSKGQKR